jgi:hypothetical protein
LQGKRNYVGPGPIFRFPPKLEKQAGLLSVVHLGDVTTKENHTGVTSTLPCQLPRVHGHGSPIEPHNHQPVLAQERQQDGIFGSAMFSIQPIGKMNDWKLRLQTEARGNKAARQICVGHQTNHSISAFRCADSSWANSFA